MRMVRRQPGVAQRPGDAQPSIHLHRAGRDVVALHARRLRRMALLGDDNLDTVERQIHRQRQANRATADDHHLSAELVHLSPLAADTTRRPTVLASTGARSKRSHPSRRWERTAGSIR